VGAFWFAAQVAAKRRDDINLSRLMPPLLLYSVNCYFKFYVQEKYRGNLHYVWVSESFDNGPPTSNPKGIYTSLKLAVVEEDEHDYKINEQKGLITARAIKWETDGEITSADKDEIVFSAMNGAFKQWRPSSTLSLTLGWLSELRRFRGPHELDLRQSIGLLT